MCVRVRVCERERELTPAEKNLLEERVDLRDAEQLGEFQLFNHLEGHAADLQQTTMYENTA